MLCPNELGCTFSRYMIPRTNGDTDHYEMFDGTFLVGDLCNFKVTNPVSSDLNDVMYFKLEYLNRCTAVLIKGESISNPIALYRLSVGQSYTALKGINFYLLFMATDETSGDFAFKIWYNNVSGYGESEPSVVTYEEDPRNPSEPDPEPEPEPEPEKPDETTDEDDKTDTTDPTDNTSGSTDTSGNTDTTGGTGTDINPDDSNQEKIGDNTVDDNTDNTTDDSGNTDTSGGTNSDSDDGLNEQETIGGDTNTDTDSNKE